MLFEKLLNKKLLLVSGKGGVGKTSIVAAMGLEAARLGKKVLLVESTSEDQLGPLFGLGTVGHSVKQVQDNIYVTNLDSELNFRDFIILHLGFAGLFEKIFTKNIVRSFIRMIPGIAEITLLGRLYYYCELEKKHNFDLVILDGYASGHFLSLLSTPDAILQSGFVGPIIEETQRVRDYLHDTNKSGMILVNTPEPLVLNESLDFIDRLSALASMELSAIVFNRYLKFETAPTYQNTDLQKMIDTLVEKAGDMKTSIESFVKDLSENPSLAKCQLILVPDLFFIEEPLTPESVSNWLERGESWGV